MKNRVILLTLVASFSLAVASVTAQDSADGKKEPEKAKPEEKQPDKKKPDEKKPEGEPEEPRRRPLVVLKQTEIEGRVFFIGAGSKDGEVAYKLKIEVRRIEDNERIYKTRTDKEGEYILPDLEVGTYHLVVGKLILELEVKDDEPKEKPSRSIPKKILVFIPRELRA